MKKIFLIFFVLAYFIITHQALAQTSTSQSIKLETKSTELSTQSIEVKKIEIKSTNEEIKKIEAKDETGTIMPIDPSKVYIITRDPEQCKPVPCQTLSVKKEGTSVIINDGGTEVKTSLPIKIEEEKISVEVSGQSETVILPSEAKKIVETQPGYQGILPTKIAKIELIECESKPGPESPCNIDESIYKIEIMKESKFLGVVLVKSELNYEIGASTGKLIAERKPWYLRLIPFLFKF